MANPFKFLLKNDAWRRFSSHWVADLTFRIFGYPRFDMANYFKIRALLRQDPKQIYVFVGQDKQSFCWKAEKLLTGATWGHAGLIYLGTDDELHITHVKHQGMLHDSALTYMKEVDRFAVGKLKFKTEESRQDAKKRILFYDRQHVEYDFEFTLEDAAVDDSESKTPPPVQALYCSEYVFRIGHNLAEGFTPTVHLQEESFTPDNVYNAITLIFEE